ncbi:lipocalin family protein [Ideonella sp. BN130291]|uniref:lipocalin family protein n=1 Tax=Ideonella sp. BN130291 TaxID=3112940 RepID=UPI002E258736|nr:lipocalin family protein [Ideonella sp. BN130291]
MLRNHLKRIEDEIQDCEARVKLHDNRLSGGARALKGELAHAASGKAVMAGGALLGTVAGLWWRRSRHHAHRGAQHADYRAGYRDGLRASRRRERGVPDLLARWSPLLMPLLTPLLDRKVAQFLSGLGVPVGMKPTPPLPTVTEIDLRRYAGRWYEIARMPLKQEERCRRDVTAEYTADDDGGMTVTNRCVREDGSVEQAEGKVRMPDTRFPGQLEVAFAPAAMRWWPGAWADYWVLFVDEDYSMALVGTPERDGLWILSRTPAVETADLEALKSLALRHGFDTDRLLRTEHTPSTDAIPGQEGRATVAPHPQHH